MYDNEAFGVFLVRRGWEFWTGKTFKMSPYEARCFPTLVAAQQAIDNNKLTDEGNDKVMIVSGTLRINGQAEQVQYIVVRIEMNGLVNFETIYPSKEAAEQGILADMEQNNHRFSRREYKIKPK